MELIVQIVMFIAYSLLWTTLAERDRNYRWKVILISMCGVAIEVAIMYQKSSNNMDKGATPLFLFLWIYFMVCDIRNKKDD